MLYALDRPDAPLKARAIGTVVYLAIVAPLCWRFDVQPVRPSPCDRQPHHGRLMMVQLRIEYRRVRGGEQSRIWVLLGPRTGDNNQALALAEALGLPFETRTLDYNPAAVTERLAARDRATLDRPAASTFSRLGPTWSSPSAAAACRSPAGSESRIFGRTKLVRIGHPRIDPKLFDLVITTRQYPVPPGDNVLLLPLAMSRFSTPPVATDRRGSAWLAALPSPRRLLAIGGATKYWSLSPRHVTSACKDSAASAAAR